MEDKQLLENANAILSLVEKKLPQGDKNIRNMLIKFTMSKPADLLSSQKS